MGKPKKNKPLQTPIKKRNKPQNQTKNKPAAKSQNKRRPKNTHKGNKFNPHRGKVSGKNHHNNHHHDDNMSHQTEPQPFASANTQGHHRREGTPYVLPRKSKSQRFQSAHNQARMKTPTPTSKGKSDKSKPTPGKKLPIAKLISKKATQTGKRFSAAGVILYSKRPDNTIVFLLGEEDRSEKNKSSKNVWLNFGGKIEKGESVASQTALRELIEETGGLFTESEIEGIKRNLTDINCPRFFIPFGNYVLFFVECPYDQTFPQRFKELDRENAKSTQTEIMWCDAKSVFEGISQNKKYFVTRNENGEDRQHIIYPFFARFLMSPQVFGFMKELLAI